MAAITATLVSSPKTGGGAIMRYYGTSTANQADTLTTVVVPTGGSQRLLYCSVNYSAAPTQAGVTVEIDRAEGATYDDLLHTFTANGQRNTYVGDPEIWLLPGDAIRLSAPAGGGVITAACSITMEQK